MYAGSGEAYKDLLPNYLMQWEMMRWSAENGVDIYDMRGIAGGATKQKPLDGLFRFKSASAESFLVLSAAWAGIQPRGG